MLAPASDPEKDRSKNQTPVALTRAEGQLEISFKQRGGETVLDHLFQQGCLKARFPALEPTGLREGVLINTAGGLTDGDRLRQQVKWGEGTKARLSGQAAERIYRSRLEDAVIDTTLELAEGAFGHWLPQETILFDGGRFRRENHINMQRDSRLIATESLVLGRTAMNEQVFDGRIHESWRIRYDDRMVFADGFRLVGDLAGQAQHPALLDGAIAFATLLYVGEDAEQIEAGMKQCCADLSSDGVRAACSLLPRVLHTRVLASSGEALRYALMTLIGQLQKGIQQDSCAVLPRVWLC